MNAMKLFSIRGACCAENSPESITQEIQTLCSTLFEKNHIKAENIVNIHFTMTPDLDTLNAASPPQELILQKYRFLFLRKQL